MCIRSGLNGLYFCCDLLKLTACIVQQLERHTLWSLLVVLLNHHSRHCVDRVLELKVHKLDMRSLCASTWLISVTACKILPGSTERTHAAAVTSTMFLG